jgi:surface protein
MNIRKRIIFNRGSSVETAFVIRVKTNNSGNTPSNQFRIGVGSGVFNYNVTTSEQTFLNQTGNVTLTWAVAGEYDVSISGIFPSILMFGNDPFKLIQIKQWGTGAWGSFLNAFRGCISLVSITATDVPNVSAVTSFSLAFRNGAFPSINLTGWDTSNATTMDTMFGSNTNIESVTGIGGLNLSNLTNINQMFNACAKLNFAVGNMDISNVTNAGSFMSGVTLSTANYDDALIKFAAQAPNALTISFGSSKYTNSGAALAARNTLTSTYSWVITDGGPL